MKITKKILENIIKEEIAKLLEEENPTQAPSTTVAPRIATSGAPTKERARLITAHKAIKELIKLASPLGGEFSGEPDVVGVLNEPMDDYMSPELRGTFCDGGGEVVEFLYGVEGLLDMLINSTHANIPLKDLGRFKNTPGVFDK